MSTPRMMRSTPGSPVLRREGVERVRPRRDPLLEQVAHLPRVVQQQARQDQEEPRVHHRAPARIPRVEALPLPHLRLAPAREVADVGVLRLAPGDRQHHDAEDHEEADPGEAGEEADRVRRVERQEDLGMPEDPRDALDGDPREPDHHHEPAEEPPHLARPAPLGLEEDEQADEGRRHRQGLAERLVGAQHADRRRDHAVGREQPRRRDDQVADQRDPEDLRRGPLQEPPEGERPPLAAVVGPHDDQVVLDRQEDERPEDEAEPAEGLPGRDEVAARLEEGRQLRAVDVMLQRHRLPGDLHEGIEDGRPDVPVHRPHRLAHAGEEPGRVVIARLAALGRVQVLLSSEPTPDRAGCTTIQ